MAPAEGGPGEGAPGKGPRKRSGRRPSSIRAAAETAAGSSASAKRPPAKPAAKRASAGPVTAKPRPAPPKARKRRPPRSGRQAAPPGRLPIQAEEIGIVDVTGALDAIPKAPEIPDLPPPEGAAPEAGGTGFPDYEVRSDTWDPWDDAGAAPGRTDPDFDAQRTLGEWLEGVIPPDAQVHFIKAGTEFAKGVQVTVDHHTSRRRASGPDPDGGANRIEIE